MLKKIESLVDLKIVVLVVLVGIGTAGCDLDNEPSPVQNHDPGSFISWRVDSIRHSTGGRVELWRMLFFDSTHIIMGGYSSDLRESLWELKNSRITRINFAGGTISLSFAPSGIYVPSNDRIGLIGQYVGDRLVEYRMEQPTNSISAMYQDSKYEYLIGLLREGIYRFDGSSFSADTVHVRLNGADDRMFYFTGFAKYNSKKYAIAKYLLRYGAAEWAYLLREDSPKRWSYVDSCYIDDVSDPNSVKFGNSRLFISSDGVMFSVGTGGAFRYKGSNEWECIVKAEACYCIGGTSSNDIFIGDIHGRFFYYNGTYSKELGWPKGSKRVVYSDIKVLEDAVFIVGTDNEREFAFLIRAKRAK